MEQLALEPHRTRIRHFLHGQVQWILDLGEPISDGRVTNRRTPITLSFTRTGAAGARSRGVGSPKR